MIELDLSEIVVKIEAAIREKITDIFENAISQIAHTDNEQLNSAIEQSPALRRYVIDYVQNTVATLIGNRLRCGIYDERIVNEVFEKMWNQEFDKAIESKIRQKVDKAIDDLIRKRLNAISG